MKNIHSIEFYTGSKEELLPGFEKDFPYIASRAELDKYIGLCTVALAQDSGAFLYGKRQH